MGDSGSMFLGFTLSGIALIGTREMASDIFFVLLIPVAMMGLPIFDTTLVTIVRTLEGRPLSQGGRDHLSHRLVAVGLSERQAVLVLYALAASFGSLGLLGRSLGVWVSLLAAGALLVDRGAVRRLPGAGAHLRAGAVRRTLGHTAQPTGHQRHDHVQTRAGRSGAGLPSWCASRSWARSCCTMGCPTRPHPGPIRT